MNVEPKPLEEMTFREAMAELDGIVARLEGNTMELEDCLKGYERGVALLAELQKRFHDSGAAIIILFV